MTILKNLQILKAQPFSQFAEFALGKCGNEERKLLWPVLYDKNGTLIF